MQYRYEKEIQDYSDLSSGRVFYSIPGHPAFPVRLASEIFQRCMASRAAIYDNSSPCTLYDPCCGVAYQLSVLGVLHRNRIQQIIASDIDEKAVDLAQRNLGLLTVAGLDRRIDEITTMIQQYNKDSHKDALKSAQALKAKLAAFDQQHELRTRIFQSSATDRQTMLDNIPDYSVDIVFTDVPYGQHSQWRSLYPEKLSDPVWSMLEALTRILSPSSIVAIASDKKQRISHDSYQRLEKFQIGKRQVVILKPI
jgi:tRNA G10  N-methylase Trm11